MVTRLFGPLAAFTLPTEFPPVADLPVQLSAPFNFRARCSL